MSLGTYAFLDNKNLIPLFQTIYEQQLNGLWARDLGTVINSTMGVESYGWLGAAPSLELLTSDDKPEEGFNKFTYTLTNKEYAKAIRIRELDMRRDKVDQITARIGEMADKAADHWNSLTSTLILNGTASGYTAYDGATFFSATHSESGTAQKNLVTASEVAALNTSSTTTLTVVEAADVIQGLIGWQYGFTDDKGDQINGTAKAFTFMVGTANLWGPLSAAVSSMNLTGGQTNPLNGLVSQGVGIKVMLNPALAAHTSNIYVFRTDSRVKPFILQEEVPLDPQVTDTSSDEYKKYRRYLFSIYTSRAVGYARWQSAMKATLS